MGRSASAPPVRAVMDYNAMVAPGATAWQHWWREGLHPLVETDGLVALRQALAADDARLIQHATTDPINQAANAHLDVLGADAIAWTGWRGNPFWKVRALENYWFDLAVRASERVRERLRTGMGCSLWLSFWDETPRPEAFRLLLKCVETELRRRGAIP